MEAPAELTGLAVVALAALLCGMAMSRFNQPPIVGYIVAGVLLGPSALGVVHDREQIGLLAELGILLLLFIIGTELSLRAFMVTWRLALTAVALQVGASVLVILAASSLLGFSWSLSILLGFVVALSSTAVAIKMLEEIGESRTRVGRITVGILIAQDLAFLPMLLVVGQLGTGGFGLGAVAKIALSVIVLVLLLRILSRRRRIELPIARVVVHHADLSPLTGLAYCFGAGALFGLLGLSAAYGAFLAGLVIGRSAQREELVKAVHPVQSVLVMTFFLSIGLLIDLRFIWDNIGAVLALLLIVTLFKTAMNVAIMRALGETWQRAFLQGLLISQLGEFSFLLAAAGLASGAIGQEDSRLVISVTVLSLAVSPLWLITARRVHGLAARQVSTLRDLLRGTYGEEAAAVQRLSTRAARGLARGARRVGNLGRPGRRAAPAAPAAGDAAAAAPPDTPDAPSPQRETTDAPAATAVEAGTTAAPAATAAATPPEPPSAPTTSAETDTPREAPAVAATPEAPAEPQPPEPPAPQTTAQTIAAIADRVRAAAGLGPKAPDLPPATPPEAPAPPASDAAEAPGQRTEKSDR